MGRQPQGCQTTDRQALKLRGNETLNVIGIGSGLAPHATLALRVHRANGETVDVPVEACIDTREELAAYRHGGILPQVYREFVASIQ